MSNINKKTVWSPSKHQLYPNWKRNWRSGKLKKRGKLLSLHIWIQNHQRVCYCWQLCVTVKGPQVSLRERCTLSLDNSIWHLKGITDPFNRLMKVDEETEEEIYKPFYNLLMAVYKGIVTLDWYKWLLQMTFLWKMEQNG